MVYWIAYFLMWTIDRIYFRVELIHDENIPRKGACIFATNHISNLDPFILGISLKQKVNFFAKESLFDTPLKNLIFRGMKAFPVKRDEVDVWALKEAVKRLKKGEPLIVFPEGTRGVSSREKKVQPGIGFIAVKSGVPIVPAYLEGTDKALPNGAKWFKRHPVKLYIGKPVEFNKTKDYQDIAQKAVDAIYALKPAV